MPVKKAIKRQSDIEIFLYIQVKTIGLAIEVVKIADFEKKPPFTGVKNL